MRGAPCVRGMCKADTCHAILYRMAIDEHLMRRLDADAQDGNHVEVPRYRRTSFPFFVSRTHFPSFRLSVLHFCMSICQNAARKWKTAILHHGLVGVAVSQKSEHAVMRTLGLTHVRYNTTIISLIEWWDTWVSSLSLRYCLVNLFRSCRIQE